MTATPSRPIRWLAPLAVLALAACATPPLPESAIAASPWAQASRTPESPGSPWAHVKFPGKVPTEFRPVRKDGRDALAVRSQASASMLRSQLRIDPQDLGRVRFSWMVPALIADADLAVRDREDATVRVILAFEGDRSRFSARDAALSELARAITGEEMPYATLMYVWSGRHPAGTLIKSARTDRIRKLVVQSGTQDLGRWLEYERDVRADYERAFGEAPGALVAVGIMTDSDNTRSRAQAWYGPVRFVASDPAATR